MPRYWQCNDRECRGFRGDIFTADRPELAVCPQCNRVMAELTDEGDEIPEREVALVREWPDGILARTWVAGTRRGEPVPHVEAEIRRRHGAVNYEEWSDYTIKNKPSGFSRGLYG